MEVELIAFSVRQSSDQMLAEDDKVTSKELVQELRQLQICHRSDLKETRHPLVP